MSNIDKQAQYESKFSRLWERYGEASHGNAEQMRDILEVTLDALESAERQILRLEKLAEAESVGADKAAISGVEWMKRCMAAEKRLAELEALGRGVKQFSEFQICHYGATEDYAKGYIDCQNNYNKVLFAAAGKGEAS